MAWNCNSADCDGDGLGDGVEVPVSSQVYEVDPDAVCVHVYVCVTPVESVHDHVQDEDGGKVGPVAPGGPCSPVLPAAPA